MNAVIHFASRLMRQMRSKQDVFSFHGGVHPDEHKAESTQLPIGQCPLPEKLVLPLRQHVGNIPKLQVGVGDYVRKGQLLAAAEGTVSAAIHAPTSGSIVAIQPEAIPHPSGLPDLCITLVPDGKETWIDRKTTDWRNTPKKDLIASLRNSGIVGLGGATFPTQIKLAANGKSPVHTLIINAAECEPYITCDDRLMRERADEIIQGIIIALHLLSAETCIIGIEDNKPEAAAAMRNACASLPNISVKSVPTLYPSGNARHLLHLLLGTEVPHDKRTTEVGLQVFNVATVLALYRYFALGEPSISRIVSMTGNVAQPQNFEALFGTPLQALVQAAGGALPGTTHFIMGGPMMGFDLRSADVPVTKAMNCVIAATPQLFASPPPAMPCIRCARCADACPVSLQPQELYWFSKSDDFEKARDYHLFDCIECGCCTYVCPSNIPLVQYYRYAKSEIIAADQQKEAANLARERNEFKIARHEREKLERAQKHAERAQAGKADTNKRAIQADAAALPSENIASTTDGLNDKQAAIAAAVARAKALKLATSAHQASAESVGGVNVNAALPSSTETEVQSKADKQALIAAAVARAKAQKLAALEAGIAPKNTDHLSAAVKAEMDQTDMLREKAKKIVAAASDSDKNPPHE